jgi:hypothetical protein
MTTIVFDWINLFGSYFGTWIFEFWSFQYIRFIYKIINKKKKLCLCMYVSNLSTDCQFEKMKLQTWVQIQ